MQSYLAATGGDLLEDDQTEDNSQLPRQPTKPGLLCSVLRSPPDDSLVISRVSDGSLWQKTKSQKSPLRQYSNQIFGILFSLYFFLFARSSSEKRSSLLVESSGDHRYCLAPLLSRRKHWKHHQTNRSTGQQSKADSLNFIINSSDTIALNYVQFCTFDKHCGEKVNLVRCLSV